MEATPAMVLTGAVEGLTDEAVLRRLAADVGLGVGAVYGRRGKAYLLRQLDAYNHAAAHAPWMALVDLDNGALCPPAYRRHILPAPAPGMALRIVVREVESWLMADREGLARFLGVSPARVPPDPEAIPDPKGAMVNLARRSRRREVRDDMVPDPAGGRSVGPAYSSRLIEFAEDRWQPREAARRCRSLARCLARLLTLAGDQP